MAESKQDSITLHRRAVRREILLPFIGGLILVVVLLLIAAIAGQVPTSAVSTTLLTVLILIPMAICLLPIYIVLVLAIFGMNRAHHGIAKPLRQLQLLSIKLRHRSESLSEQAARASISVNARFAPLDKLVFSLFDRNEDNNE